MVIVVGTAAVNTILEVSARERREGAVESIQQQIGIKRTEPIMQSGAQRVIVSTQGLIRSLRTGVQQGTRLSFEGAVSAQETPSDIMTGESRIDQQPKPSPFKPEFAGLFVQKGKKPTAGIFGERRRIPTQQEITTGVMPAPKITIPSDVISGERQLPRYDIIQGGGPISLGTGRPFEPEFAARPQPSLQPETQETTGYSLASEAAALRAAQEQRPLEAISKAPRAVEKGIGYIETFRELSPIPSFLEPAVGSFARPSQFEIGALSGAALLIPSAPAFIASTIMDPLGTFEATVQRAVKRPERFAGEIAGASLWFGAGRAPKVSISAEVGESMRVTLPKGVIEIAEPGAAIFKTIAARDVLLTESQAIAKAGKKLFKADIKTVSDIPKGPLDPAISISDVSIQALKQRRIGRTEGFVFEPAGKPASIVVKGIGKPFMKKGEVTFGEVFGRAGKEPFYGRTISITKKDITRALSVYEKELSLAIIKERRPVTPSTKMLKPGARPAAVSQTTINSAMASVSKAIESVPIIEKAVARGKAVSMARAGITAGAIQMFQQPQARLLEEDYDLLSGYRVGSKQAEKVLQKELLGTAQMEGLDQITRGKQKIDLKLGLGTLTGLGEMTGQAQLEKQLTAQAQLQTQLITPRFPIPKITPTTGRPLFPVGIGLGFPGERKGKRKKKKPSEYLYREIKHPLAGARELLGFGKKQKRLRFTDFI